jgi:hypothetical protein
MAPEDLGQLTFGDCRNAARVVHKAEFGKEARKSRAAPWGVGAIPRPRAADAPTEAGSAAGAAYVKRGSVGIFAG